MIGLLLVTHGRLADEFLAALEHVVGPQERIETVSIDADDDMAQRRQDIVDAVGRVACGKGVIILTDMFGGTPSNLAISVMDAKHDGGPVEVISGLNLPMLIKLAQARGDTELPALVEAAQAAGRKYISVASALLGSKQA
jgi:PTS system mannose-specific IIA component